MNMNVKWQRIANLSNHNDILKSLQFFNGKLSNHNVTRNILGRLTACLRLLITGLIVPLRLWIVSIAYQ